MFLKSLSMKGFKSFADPTVLEFEPGITVVVGPNGSGKSNVVDAVTWVLGAQGPRSLRSQRMEDVIFAGTNSRPALGRAEVSLTIDNSLHKLPIDMAEVTITRTLFRSGDSEYAINSAPCRLLDVQELLSDTGVGRQQHMIIGQGQLDTVLNARPEDRRAIIEEAAGVLKHRRRRERAERRLATTQENLERLGDLVREVRRQIRPLERQATAARSHATLAEELHVVRMYLASNELRELSGRRSAAAEALVGIAAEEHRLAGSIEQLDSEATATSAELRSRSEDDLASSLGHLEGLVERARGLGGVLRERARGILAALDAAADIDVVSTLESEGARLAAELAVADTEEAALQDDVASLASVERSLSEDDSAYVDEFGDGEARDREHEAAEQALDRACNRIEVLDLAVEHGRAFLEAADERVVVVGGRARGMAGKIGDGDRRGAELEEGGRRIADDLAVAAEAVESAKSVVEAAEQAAYHAEQQRHRAGAKAEALERALREMEGGAGREALEGVDGIVGSLGDLVDVDAGWEAAFEAAAGAVAAAIVVDGRDAARAALTRLHRHGATAALLAPVVGGSGGFAGGGELPRGAEWLRAHVRPRGASDIEGTDVDGGGPGAFGGGVGHQQVAGILDALLGRVVRVGGWEEAIDLALDRPDLVVVTGQGDRFSDSGWQVRSATGVVTRSAVEEAMRQAAVAVVVAERAGSDWEGAREKFEMARDAFVEGRRALDRHESVRTAFESDRARLIDEHVALVAESAMLQNERDAAAERLEADVRERGTLVESVPTLERMLGEVDDRHGRASEARRELVARRDVLSLQRQELDVRIAGLDERRRVLQDRRSEVDRRLEGHVEEREQAAARRKRLEADGVGIDRLSQLVETERSHVEGALASARIAYQQQVEAVRTGSARLEELRRERADAEHSLSALRERARALDLESTEVALRSEALVATVERELGEDPDELDHVVVPELPEGVSPAAHAADLAERLAKLGPVNPLALEELSVLEERHQDLENQVSDVREARRKLQDVIHLLDEEIMQTFASAAADVNTHFSTLVEVLFPGGTGRLSLVEPDDLLNTGVEIEVRPAGRNVRRVSLLSGGERSLVALAFLFAVFRSRPSPFYFMDEVEAALDDVNLTRFLGLVREFREESQLIIVSHQKRTMETGDALYGVTMAPGGSSQVVSQKMSNRVGAAQAVPATS